MFEALKHHKKNPQCQQVSMLKKQNKTLHGKKLVKNTFQVGQEVMLYKSCWKGLLCKWKSRTFGPFIMNEVFADRH